LLRLYALHPARANSAILSSVLIKALMALPDPDFLLSLYLIPESSHTPLITLLVSLEALLQKGKFAAFWNLLNAAEEAANRTAIQQVPGFEDAVREFVVGALNRTYNTVEKSVLAASLGVADASAICSARGWQTEGSLVHLPGVPENTPRPKKRDEETTGLRYSEIAGIVQSLTRQ
jgi:translation initiation factor 3 subunit K